MLAPDGLKIARTVGIKGESKRKEGYRPQTVIFDRDYVVSKLAKELAGLRGLSWNEVQKLVSQAYKQTDAN